MVNDDEKAALAVADRLAESCAALLGAAVESIILHGSLTMDDFVPGVSDIDVFIVVKRELAVAEIDALVKLVGEADLGPAGGIDLLVVTAQEAAEPAHAPAMELHVGLYPRTSVGLEVEPKVPHAPDLLAELSMARATGRALMGAAPSEVMGEPSASQVHQRGLHWLTTWLSLTDDDENAVHMVLTACRIWLFAIEGVHGSKAEAGRWALDRDSSLTAVAQALRRRNGDPSVRIDEAGVRRVLEVVRDDIGASGTASTAARAL